MFYKINCVTAHIAMFVCTILCLCKKVPFYIIPFSFVVSLFAMFFLLWLVIALVSLTVPMKKKYEKPSKFYAVFFNLAYEYLYNLAGARVCVSGLEKVPNVPFVFVCNHRSNFDNMVASVVLKKHFLSFVSKPSNFKIPMGRHFMVRNLYLSIDRESPLKALRVINEAGELVKNGVTSIGIYPEGHRSKTKEMGEFKEGFIRIAKIASCPIVVSTIIGTEQIHKNFPYKKTKVTFEILDVISPDEVATQTPAVLSDKIKNIMQENLIKKGEIQNDARTLQPDF